MYTQTEVAALDEKDYRDAYVEGQVAFSVAHQIRCIRENLGLTQKAFAELVGKPQSVISRLEDVEYGKITVQTLLDLAARLDIALVVKFVTFPEFLDTYGDISPDRSGVLSYQQTGAATSTMHREVEPTSGVMTPIFPQSGGGIQVMVGDSFHVQTPPVFSPGAMAVVGFSITPYMAINNMSVSGQ